MTDENSSATSQSANEPINSCARSMTARPYPRRRWSGSVRSEEHTSELQSPCNLVCRLLLEKKKKNHTPHCTVLRSGPTAVATFARTNTVGACAALRLADLLRLRSTSSMYGTSLCMRNTCYG